MGKLKAQKRVKWEDWATWTIKDSPWIIQRAPSDFASKPYLYRVATRECGRILLSADKKLYRSMDEARCALLDFIERCWHD